MLEHHQLALEVVERLDVGSRRLPGEDAGLDLFDFVLEGVDDREVPVDDGIHQRVEDVGRAVAQQVRLALGSSPNVAEATADAVADREHVALADEDVHFAHPHFGTLDFEHVQNREERSAVLLDLRTLMAVARVLHGQRMQVELPLKELELGRIGIGDGDPHKTSGLADDLPDLGDRNVGDLVAVLVGDAVDEHAEAIEARGRRRSSCRQRVQGPAARPAPRPRSQRPCACPR